MLDCKHVTTIGKLKIIARDIAGAPVFKILPASKPVWLVQIRFWSNEANHPVDISTNLESAVHILSELKDKDCEIFELIYRRSDDKHWMNISSDLLINLYKAEKIQLPLTYS